jgi:hypothetical protein
VYHDACGVFDTNLPAQYTAKNLPVMALHENDSSSQQHYWQVVISGKGENPRHHNMSQS